MRSFRNKRIYFGISLIAVFLLWTLAVAFVDVRAIGPKGSSVGLAGLNGFIHDVTGENLLLYTVTDYLSIVPFLVVGGFAFLGAWQLIRRRSILKVDKSILVLGVFYIVVLFAYLAFKIIVINYRPVLIDGVLEASYPSSTTMLVMCVMPTLPLQLKHRINNKALRWVVTCATVAFVLFMVLARLISGVHWVTDIIGGAMLSAGLVLLYDGICRALKVYR